MPKEDTDAYIQNCLPNSPQPYGIARAKAFGTGTVIEEEGNLSEPRLKDDIFSCPNYYLYCFPG